MKKDTLLFLHREEEKRILLAMSIAYIVKVIEKVDLYAVTDATFTIFKMNLFTRLIC